MNLRRWLTRSLWLNLLLGAWLVCSVKSHLPHPPSPVVSQAITQRPFRAGLGTNVLATVVEVTAPFHWRELESADYRVYIANLRAIGCPELTIYDIVSADVGELYSRRVEALVDSVTGRFWDYVASPEATRRMVDEKQQELRALEDEKDGVMKALFGEISPGDELRTEEVQRHQLANDQRTFDFLSAEPLAKVIEIRERADAARRSAQELPAAERQQKLKEVQENQEEELQAALTPAEYAEYRLRTSGAANVCSELASFDGTEAEFRALALAKMNPQSDQSIPQLLGPDKFAAYQRALDYEYGNALRLTDRFDLPDETAVQLYEVKRAIETKAKALAADPTQPPAARTAALQALRTEAEQSLAAALSPVAFKAYQRYNGAWLEALTR